MLQPQAPNTIYSFFWNLYPELKFWIWFGGAIWSVTKIINWFKTIKTNDLAHIQSGVEELSIDMKAQTVAIQADMKAQTLALQMALKEQTQSFINEVKELRQDLRGFTNAFIVPPRARAKRK